MTFYVNTDTIMTWGIATHIQLLALCKRFQASMRLKYQRRINPNFTVKLMFSLFKCISNVSSDNHFSMLINKSLFNKLWCHWMSFKFTLHVHTNGSHVSQNRLLDINPWSFQVHIWRLKFRINDITLKWKVSWFEHLQFPKSTPTVSRVYMLRVKYVIFFRVLLFQGSRITSSYYVCDF